MRADLGVVAETENEGLEYLTVTFHGGGGAGKNNWVPGADAYKRART